jgi:hypothetical protein
LGTGYLVLAADEGMARLLDLCVVRVPAFIPRICPSSLTLCCCHVM